MLRTEGTVFTETSIVGRYRSRVEKLDAVRPAQHGPRGPFSFPKGDTAQLTPQNLRLFKLFEACDVSRLWAVQDHVAGNPVGFSLLLISTFLDLHFPSDLLLGNNHVPVLRLFQLIECRFSVSLVAPVRLAHASRAERRIRNLGFQPLTESRSCVAHH